MKRALWIGLGIATLLALAGCGKSGGNGSASGRQPVGEAPGLQGGQPINVGLYASLTGDSANWGKASEEAVRLAVEQYNAKGGFNGRPIQLLVEDDQSTPERSKTVAEKLVHENRVVALLGEVASGNTMMGMRVAQAAGIPAISSASTRVDLANIGDSFNRVCYMDDFQGASCGRYALEQGWKRMALFIDRKNPYAEGLAKNFEDYVVRHGGQIIIREYYQRGDIEYNAQLFRIKKANPDVLFIPGYHTEVIAIVRQARSQGLAIPFLGGDGWDNPDLFKCAGSAIVGARFSDHFTADDPAPHVRDFVEAYKEKYGKKPEAIGALGYDSAMVLFDAMKRAGTVEPNALKKAIRGTKGFQGVTGKITIDEKGNARKSILIIEIQKDGSFKPVQRYDWFDPSA
jgi:branched-chain amino acid transport system substrate-binding protein